MLVEQNYLIDIAHEATKRDGAWTRSVQSEITRSIETQSPIPDATLLSEIQRGSSEALGSLFRRYAHPVHNVARRILRDDGEAEDLVQDVFLFILRNAALYSGNRGGLASWIIHVAYHRAFDRLRYLKTRSFYSTRELDDSAARSLRDARREAPQHDRSIEGILGRGIAGRISSTLTPEQFETIQLFFFDGYTLNEISGLTGRSIINVRSHYYRGLERLRKFISSEKIVKGEPEGQKLLRLRRSARCAS